MNLPLFTPPRSAARHLPKILAGAAGLVAVLTWGLGGATPVWAGPAPAAPLLVLALAAGTVLALHGGHRPALRRAGLLAGGAVAVACLASVLLAALETGERLPGRIPRSVALTFLAAAGALELRWASRSPSWAQRQAAGVLALVPLGVGTLGVLGLVSGMPGLYGTQRPFLGLPMGTGALLMGLALVGAAGSDVWPMALFRMRHPAADAADGRRFAHGSLLVFLLAGVAILGLGSLYLRGQIRSDRASAELELTEVGDLKVRQISQWYEERRRDGEGMFQSGLVQTELVRFLAGGAQAPPQAEVLEWLRSQQEGQYRRAILFDAQGRPRLSVPPAEFDPGFALGNRDTDRLQLGLRARRVVLQDLHREAGGGGIHMGMWVPVGPAPAAGAPARGALLLLVDPRQFLFPLVQSWPGPSRSAETLLVRRDGDSVAFLNDVRHRAGTALSLRLPLASHPDLPAARAVLGQEGVIEGLDYRGVPVLAALRTIPGTPWALVTKVDQAEIFGAARRKVWLVEGALLALVALAALALGLFVRKQDLDQIQARLQAEREQRLLSDRYAHLMEQASDIIILLDPQGRILEANAQAVAHYGYPLETLRSLTISALRAPETVAEVSAQFARALTGEAVRFETRHRRADGTTFPVEVSGSWVAAEGAVLSFVRDISERQAQERELRRMARLYAALSQVNQAIVWSPDRQSLMDRICEVMTRLGGFRMAWIGWSDPAGRRLAVVARHGDDRGMLDRVVVRTDDSPEGQGAMGTAIRLDSPCVINDFLDHPASLPWRHELTDSGFAATAAFPVHQGGEVRGALAVYAGEKDFFGADEVALLEEAALDISFALDHLAGEERRRVAEAALQESERFLQRAQEAGGVGTYAWRIPEDRWHGSPYLDRIFGIDESHPRDLAGWIGLVAPEHRAAMEAYVAGILARHESFDHEYPILRPADGARRWLHGRGEFQWDDQGRPLTLTGVILDITERKASEQALRASEEKFATAFHASPDSVNINRLNDGVYLAVNEGFTHMTGYSEAEVIGRSSMTGELDIWVRPEDRERLGADLRSAGKVVGLEAPFRRKDGSVLTGLMSASLIEVDGEPALLSIVRDISELRDQARQLERLTQMYAALSQVNQSIVWSSDRQGLLDRICQVMVEFGRFSLAWIGWREPDSREVRVAAQCGDSQGFLDRLPRDGGHGLAGSGPGASAIVAGRPCILNDFQAGTGPWCEVARRCGYASAAAFPIRQGSEVRGALTVYSTEPGFFGRHEVALLEEAAGDVSFALDHLEGERRRKEAEAAQARLLFILESSLNEIYVFDPDSLGLVYVNRSAQDNLGYAWETLQGLKVLELEPEFTEAYFRRTIQPLMRHERTQVTYETQHRRADGSRYPVEVHLRLVERDDERYFLAIAMDRTERQAADQKRRALEAQLHQSQKLESLGSLAGGVAHDMNNVLGAILSLASSLREKADPASPEFRSLDTIQTACLRGRGVVKSLLYFARKDLQEEAGIDLNALVREITQLLSHTTLKRIQLEMDLQEPLGRLRGDAGALSHALMNLCVNSLDAMPGQGRLRIQTAGEPGGGVLVRVADTGQGMEPEVLQRAMEPFFTTKPQGKGTGLGLSMVYGTMKAHEGEFELRSEPGLGTEAILRFPASRVEPLAASPELEPLAGVEAVEGLRILLVDDDDLIRESMATLLETLGHSTLDAPGGQVALDLLEAGHPVDLVILDVNMPGMNGTEALARILALRPGLPVLMATGYSDEDIEPLLASYPNVSCILKPFSTKELKRKIGEMDLRLASARKD